MLAGDDEIDSLLALMGSGPGQTSASTSTTTSSAQPTREGTSPSKPKPDDQQINERAKKRKKKRKHKEGRDEMGKKTKHAKSKKSTTFADTRLSQNCFDWPCSNDGQHCLFLGSGLLHGCKGYSFSSNDQQSQDISYGSIPCQSCGKSAATHELCLSSSGADDVDDSIKAYNPLSIISAASLIVASRNTRCLLGEYYPTSTTEKQKAKHQVRESKNELLPPTTSTPSSPSKISNALDAHLGKVLVSVKNMQNEIMMKPSRSKGSKKRGHNKLASIASISVSDVQLLQEKTSALINSVQDYKKAIAFDVSSSHIVERRLTALASCDAVYYRCYYSAVVSQCGISGDGSLMASMIPHPPSYFSCPGLAWDVQNAGVESFHIFMGECRKELGLAAPLDGTSKQVLLESWELKARLSSPSLRTNSDIIEESNPFLILWQSRFFETIRHNWCTRYSAVKSPIALREASNSANGTNRAQNPRNNSQESILKIHETEAISPAVAQWRDSVRDYPANFYAYAAPTSDVLLAISSCLESLDVEQILEAGAGTGYWSALLVSHLKCLKKKANRLERNEKVSHGAKSVIAYDVAPPSSHTAEYGDGSVAVSNEYHGNIPTFTQVHQADSFSQALSTSITKGAKLALLLCYPPPGSDMALSALSAYISNGGQIVLHVGEWQGLTGDAKFEALLTSSFCCGKKDVIRLPLWGTDATYLTVWRKKGVDEGVDAQPTQTNSLSPSIGYCSAEKCTNLARRRCRYARCLQYCSFNCYENHSSQRRAALALHMIQTISGHEMRYDDDSYFVDLSSIDAPEIERMSDAGKKRRKKKKKRH